MLKNEKVLSLQPWRRWHVGDSAARTLFHSSRTAGKDRPVVQAVKEGAHVCYNSQLVNYVANGSALRMGPQHDVFITFAAATASCVWSQALLPRAVNLLRASQLVYEPYFFNKGTLLQENGY